MGTPFHPSGQIAGRPAHNVLPSDSPVEPGFTSTDPDPISETSGPTPVGSSTRDYAACRLIKVPTDFEVFPLLNVNLPKSKTLTPSIFNYHGETCREKQNQQSELPKLAYNYNIITYLAAIGQIIYGSYQLYIYNVSGDQISNFGVGSYSFAVIPYLIMSLINLLVALFEPTYPAMFLVFYGGPKRPTAVEGLGCMS